MCGGRSLHKEDWLKVGLGTAAAMTGLGAAGIGPMAGLFGGAASAAGAGAAGAAGMTAAELAAAGAGTAAGTSAAGTAAGLGELASVGEIGGTMLGGAAPQAVTPELTLGGLLGKAGKGMDAYQRAMALANMASGGQGGAPAPGAAPPRQAQATNSDIAGIQSIYGIDPRKRREYY